MRAVQALGVGASPVVHPAGWKLHAHDLSHQLSKVSAGIIFSLGDEIIQI